MSNVRSCMFIWSFSTGHDEIKNDDRVLSPENELLFAVGSVDVEGRVEKERMNIRNSRVVGKPRNDD